MSPTHETLPDRTTGPLFSSLARRHRSSGPSVGALVVLAIAAVAAGLGWLWMRSRASDPGSGTTVPTMARPADPAPTMTEPAAPPLELPELSASDAFVRGLVGRLSAHPRLAGWLVSEDLVRHFVLTVVRLAGGESPASELRFLAPEGDFRVREVGGRLFIDPVGYRRYDVVTEAFASLDTRGAVLLYEQLHPLFEEAYRELGITDHTFDQSFELAVGNLLAAPVPAAAPEVWLDEAVYAFRDPALEELTPAEKHVLRMGPENARRFQGKLGQIADGLGIERP